MSNNDNPTPMVQWSDDLSYGVQAMDDDHKVMISLVNHLNQFQDSSALTMILFLKMDITYTP